MAEQWSAQGRGGGWVRAAALLLLLLFLATLATPASAEMHVVGDKKQWRPGVNYTEWSLRHRFHVQDWLVFYFQKGMYDVVQVRNKTAYDQCLADDPVLNWSRGHSYAMQLSNSGTYYFICSRGYCFGGMKLSILVEPLPLPAPASPPAPSRSDASATFPTSWSATIAAVSAAWAALL